MTAIFYFFSPRIFPFCNVFHVLKHIHKNEICSLKFTVLVTLQALYPEYGYNQPNNICIKYFFKLVESASFDSAVGSKQPA